MYCRNCGNPLNINSDKCTYCGYKNGGEINKKNRIRTVIAIVFIVLTVFFMLKRVNLNKTEPDESIQTTDRSAINADVVFDIKEFYKSETQEAVSPDFIEKRYGSPNEIKKENDGIIDYIIYEYPEMKFCFYKDKLYFLMCENTIWHYSDERALPKMFGIDYSDDVIVDQRGYFTAKNCGAKVFRLKLDAEASMVSELFVYFFDPYSLDEVVTE